MSLGGPMCPIHPVWGSSPSCPGIQYIASSPCCSKVCSHGFFKQMPLRQFPVRLFVASLQSRPPRGWCGCGPQGRSILAESQHPAYNKSIMGWKTSQNSVGNHFHTFLMFFEWLEQDILKICDFGNMSGSICSKSRKKHWVLKMPTQCPGPIFQIPAKKQRF